MGSPAGTRPLRPSATPVRHPTRGFRRGCDDGRRSERPVELDFLVLRLELQNPGGMDLTTGAPSYDRRRQFLSINACQSKERTMIASENMVKFGRDFHLRDLSSFIKSIDDLIDFRGYDTILLDFSSTERAFADAMIPLVVILRKYYTQENVLFRPILPQSPHLRKIMLRSHWIDLFTGQGQIIPKDITHLLICPHIHSIHPSRKRES